VTTAEADLSTTPGANQPKEQCMFEIGEKVFIRTVTFHYIGEISERDGDWLTLKNASWVADSGRFHVAIRDGKLNEVEFVGDASVNLATATDALPWKHDLPSESK
jgi:hypothetical protein